jgi:hypothetical protein
MASNLSILQLDPQGHTTCIGIAKKTGQQCRNAVGKKYRNEAQRLLEINDQHGEGRIKEKLFMLAGLLLCKRNHQCQCDSQVFQWMDLMRGRGRQFGLLTPFSNPVNWAAFVAARPSGLTAPPEAVLISRIPRPIQAAFVAVSETGLRISRPSPKLIASQVPSVAASETGPKLETPFSNPEWTEPPNQATSVAAAEADEIKCLIYW